MSETPQIAVVEDDAPIRTLIVDLLSRENFTAHPCEDGKSLDRLIESQRIDVIVLDLMLPGEDGLEICKRLAARRVAPMIVVSAKGDDVDRIIGLELGADDYLAKPFNPRELVARIRSLLRRQTAGPEPIGDDVLTFAGWTMETGARRLMDPSGAPVQLTGAEFDLLLAFLRNPQKVLTRDELLAAAQGRSGASSVRTIDVQVCRLRQKLHAENDEDLFKSIRGVGYTFTGKVSRVRPGP